jgi:glycerol kinase
MSRYVLALDQGTTSSRAILFDQTGAITAMAQQEFGQHFPAPGWVEHNAEEIWATQQATLHAVLAQAGISAAELAAALDEAAREGMPLAEAIELLKAEATPPDQR